MAIIIPSKNIYEMNNPKVRDNLVNNVSVERTVVTQDNQYDYPVFNTKIDNLTNTTTETDKNGNSYVRTANTYEYKVTALFSRLNAFYFSFSVIVPRVDKNKRVSSLSQKEEDIVKVSVYTKKKSGVASGIIHHTDYNGKDLINASDIVTNYTKENAPSINQLTQTKKDEDGKDDKENRQEIVFEKKQKDFYGDTLLSKIVLDDKSTVASPTVEEDDQFFVLSASVLVGKEEISLYGYNTEAYTSFHSKSGECVYYEPTQIEITVYGNTIGIDLTDGSINYTDGGGNKPFSLSRNELLQDSATTKGVATTKWLADNVLRQYQTGKETAVIRCDINDYFLYDSENIQNKGDCVISTSGKIEFPKQNLSIRTFDMNYAYWIIEIALPQGQFASAPITVQYSYTLQGVKYEKEAVISKGSRAIWISLEDENNPIPQNLLILDAFMRVEKTIFGIGNVVVPMVYGADGQDYPMSLYKDGTPKEFAVVGTNIFYDGAVWQELTLQEVLQGQQ